MGRKSLLGGGNSGEKTNGTTYHDPRDSTASPRGSTLMDASHSKHMFQIIIGAWQSRHIITMKEPRSKVVSHVTKMLDSLLQIGL
jgi:hypothetical protein